MATAVIDTTPSHFKPFVPSPEPATVLAVHGWLRSPLEPTHI
jgi:hypothetical protein